MATTTEEIVEQEQQKDREAEQALDPQQVELDPEHAAEGELFDKSIYEREDLALPKVDGEGTDKIAIAFSGTVLLDRSDPADVALMRAMKLGGDITLQVEAKCSSKAHKFSTDREGDLDAVVLQHTAKVHTVYRPPAKERVEIEEAAA